MGNLTFSGGRYWEASEAASIPASTLALVRSLDDRVIGKFANTTAKNNGIASLTSDQRKGAMIWQDGVGFIAHDGTAERDVLVKGMNFAYGRRDVTIEGNGYARILSSQCFFQGAPPSWILANGINRDFRPTWDGFTDGSGALLKVYDAAGAQYAPNATVAFYWLALR